MGDGALECEGWRIWTLLRSSDAEAGEGVDTDVRVKGGITEQRKVAWETVRWTDEWSRW